MQSSIFDVTIILMAIVLFVGGGNAAAQEVTDVRDSVNFFWKYEMDVDPTDVNAIDLDTNSYADFIFSGEVNPLVSGGTMSLGTTTPQEDTYCQSSGDENIWQNIPINGALGYTVEMRVRVDTITGEDQSMSLLTSPLCNWSSSAKPIGLLHLSPDGQTWGHGTHTVLGSSNDNSDDFHIFRIAQVAGRNNFSIWRDGVRLASGITTDFVVGYDYRRLIFGDFYNENSGGDLEIDYVRFTSGAYAPTDETVYVALPPSVIKPSDEFIYKYEMNVNPTDAGSIDLDGNSLADWSNVIGKTPVSVSDGVMTLPNNSFLGSGYSASSNLWPNVGFTGENGFSFEMSMKVVEQTGTAGVMPMVFDLSDSDESFQVRVAEDSLKILQSNVWVEWEMDLTDDFHEFRLARDADVDGGRWWVWCDGELLTVGGAQPSKYFADDSIYMGPAVGSAYDGIVDVEYIRLMEGSFSPENPYLPGDANRSGTIDAEDAAILAAHWLTNTAAGWAEGDFNSDGVVDDKDATILATNWTSGSSSNSVPEPGVMMLLVGSLCLLWMRRK